MKSLSRVIDRLDMTLTVDRPIKDLNSVDRPIKIDSYTDSAMPFNRPLTEPYNETVLCISYSLEC